MPEPVADVARAACAAHCNDPAALLEILHAVQARLGHVPRAAVPEIAEALNRSRAEVHGVVSYYHDFRAEPPGLRVIKLCRAEACQARGCEKIVTHVESRCGVTWGATSEDRAVTLEDVYCLGNCALGPAALVDGKLLGLLTPGSVEMMVKAAQSAKAATS